MTPIAQASDHGTPPALTGDHRTLGEALAAAGRQFGDRDAFIVGDQRLTYGRWAAAAQGLAAALQARGIRAGDRVAVILPSSTDYAICTAAIEMAGAIASGINPRLGTREIDGIFDRSTPRLMITEDAFVPPPGIAQVPRLTRGDLSALYDHPADGLDLSAVDPAAAACIVWTSGTTGQPKGVWFDHANLKAAVATAGVMAAPYDRCLIPLPFAHAGYMAKQWQQIAFAVTYVLTPPVWSAPEMLRLLVEERITAAFGVPTQWAKLLALPEFAESDFSALRFCGTSTAPAPPELVEALTRITGCPMISRYAMTESPSICGTRVGDPPDVLYRSVGRPQDGVALRIVDDTGRDLPQGEVGRICLKGPVVMRGYWNDPEATARAFTADGWLITDDTGRLDSDGNLILHGRLADMYIRGGYNVYPLEVERVLTEHPGVAQVAIVGKTAPVIGEIGVAFVVPQSPDAPPSVDDLRQWCRRHLADYKAPDEIQVVPDLPLTPMMKVNKNALRDRLT
jgi:acyl-CoA synthetase (AMP-forming)/AMP-acid ligase II